MFRILQSKCPASQEAVPAEAAVLDPVPEEESPERRASMEPT